MDQNEDYGLDAFRTAVFGGFRKNDVLEYLDSLVEEVAQIRKDKKELEIKLTERESQLRQEKSRADKAEKLLGEADKERDEIEALLDELDAQAEEYDKLKTELDAQTKDREKLKTGLDIQTEEYEKMKTELRQLHQMKAENERFKEENEHLKEESEKLQQEKQLLEQSLAEAESKVGRNETEAHYKALCSELEERINAYEKRKATASEVLINARLEAEHILAEAESRANYTIRQAELQKRTAETVVQRFATQNIGQMKLIKQQMQEYLDILSGVYQGVEQARSGLSQSVIGIPEELETLQRIIEGDIVVESSSYRMDDMP